MVVSWCCDGVGKCGKLISVVYNVLQFCGGVVVALLWCCRFVVSHCFVVLWWCCGCVLMLWWCCGGPGKC